VRTPRAIAPVLLASALALATSSSADASIVERVVAVVGDQPILLTSIRERARPFLIDLQRRGLSPAQQAAAESELFRQLLERMIDERLQQIAAERARIRVTAEEIDAGIRNVAASQQLTTAQLLAEAARQGLSAQDYREEIRRQILEGKLLQLRMQGRIRVTDDEIEAMYEKLVRAERRNLDYRVAWVVLHVPEGLSQAQLAERQRLAESIAKTARAGVDREGRPVDFASLAAACSDDTTTKERGGDLGRHEPGDLASEVEEEIFKLDVGGVSAPFRFKDAIVVLKVLDRDPSRIPTLEQARDEVAQRVYSEQMDKARKKWLEELRRGAHVDVRL